MVDLVRRLVVVKSLPFWGSAGLQRRADGLLHDVNSTGGPCGEPVETDEWIDCEDTTSPQAHAERIGGARRDRTDDLMLAKHALSQLSYGPIGNRW